MTTTTTDAAIDAAFPGYWSALQSGDRRSALRIAVELQESGVPLVDLLDLLVARAQSEVGRRWAADEWSVAQEHRATSIGEDVVHVLARDLDAPSTGRRVMLSCVDGEWHTLPGRMLTAVLRSEGYEVTYLGASVPARHLTAMLHDDGPDVVALSCALPTALPAARQTIELSRAAGIPVVVGGRGFGPAGRWGLALGASSWAPDARTAATALDLPAFVDPVTRPGVPGRCVPFGTEASQAGGRGLHVPSGTSAAADVDGYDNRQLARTREDFGYIARLPRRGAVR